MAVLGSSPNSTALGALKRARFSLQKLMMLSALGLQPGYQLHELKGKLKGHWAISVSGNWRIVFSFKDGDAYVVNYEDYH